MRPVVRVVLPLADGSLRDALSAQRDAFSAHAAVALLCGIARGMTAIHAQAILHLDLKVGPRVRCCHTRACECTCTYILHLRPQAYECVGDVLPSNTHHQSPKPQPENVLLSHGEPWVTDFGLATSQVGVMHA